MNFRLCFWVGETLVLALVSTPAVGPSLEATGVGVGVDCETLQEYWHDGHRASCGCPQPLPLPGLCRCGTSYSCVPHSGQCPTLHAPHNRAWHEQG
jgi:hypothetical protein